MNKARREAISKLAERIEEIRGEVETLRDEEQDYFDAMPESLQGGEKGELAVEAINAIEDAIAALEEASSQLGAIS